MPVHSGLHDPLTRLPLGLGTRLQLTVCAFQVDMLFMIDTIATFSERAVH